MDQEGRLLQKSKPDNTPSTHSQHRNPTHTPKHVNVTTEDQPKAVSSTATAVARHLLLLQPPQNRLLGLEAAMCLLLLLLSSRSRRRRLLLLLLGSSLGSL
jgi:hypothetical protein